MLIVSDGRSLWFFMFKKENKVGTAFCLSFLFPSTLGFSHISGAKCIYKNEQCTFVVGTNYLYSFLTSHIRAQAVGIQFSRFTFRLHSSLRLGSEGNLFIENPLAAEFLQLITAQPGIFHCKNKQVGIINVQMQIIDTYLSKYEKFI